MITSLFLLTLLTFSHQASKSDDSGQFSCLNEDGEPVDWYIAYKFPELQNQPSPFDSGHAYAYITSDNQEDKGSKPKDVFIPKKSSVPKVDEHPRFSLFDSLKSIWRKVFGRDSYKVHSNRRKRVANDDMPWIISAKLITDPKSIVLRTLAIAYEKESKLNSILYNDGPPKHFGLANHSGTKAHAKGVVLMDDESGKGLWLTHSMPLFPPPVNSTLEFEQNSKYYGQTFMCINFDIQEAGKQVVDHLVNMNPVVYDTTISNKLRTLIPDIDYLKPESKRRRKHNQDVSKLAQAISTLAGQQLYLYSKSASFGEDIYADWIDDELNADLYVATWRRGNGTPLNSSCPRDHHHVNNVQDFKIVEGDKKMTWSYLHDHSKWAISDDEKMALVCISDVNRMRSQFKRGGGAVCIKCSSCWTAFSKIILDLQSCPKTPINQDSP